MHDPTNTRVETASMPYKAWRRVFEWRATSIEAAKYEAAVHHYNRGLMKSYLREWCENVGPPSLISSSEGDDYDHDDDDNDDDSSTDEDYYL